MAGSLYHMALHKLQERERSGYGLCEQIEQSIGKRPSYGTIYPLLERLQKERLVRVRKEGRKKMYSLTSKGKHETQRLSREREELVENLETQIRALFELTGQDPGPILVLLGRLKEGKSPLGRVTARMFVFRDTVFRMVQDGRAERHAGRINDMLDEMTKKLEALE